jgi:hypothetical protein
LKHTPWIKNPTAARSKKYLIGCFLLCLLLFAAVKNRLNCLVQVNCLRQNTCASGVTLPYYTPLVTNQTAASDRSGERSDDTYVGTGAKAQW